MLFRKQIEPSCSYCVHGQKISDCDVVCGKKGIVPVEGSCRKFRYDPVKREPPRPIALKTKGLSSEDFSI